MINDSLTDVASPEGPAMKTRLANRLYSMRWILSVCLVCSFALTNVAASTQPSVALSNAASSLTAGFESQLWDHFYRSEQDASEHHDNEAIPNHSGKETDSSRAARHAQDQLRSAHSEQVASQIVPKVAVSDSEESSDEESHAPAAISDWTIAKLSASHGEIYTPRSDGGPSATTILVGIVAAIVLTGAMFAGKE